MPPITEEQFKEEVKTYLDDKYSPEMDQYFTSWKDKESGYYIFNCPEYPAVIGYSLKFANWVYNSKVLGGTAFGPSIGEAEIKLMSVFL